VQPARALRALDPAVPVLLIGAGDDQRMPPENVRALFAALPTLPERKWLWICEDAEHGKVWEAAPEEYQRWLEQLLRAVEARG
jgi:pimeloyl-ACP methyl ester carboxylesterase